MRRRVSPPDGAAARDRLPVREARQRKSRNLVQPDHATNLHDPEQRSQPVAGECDLEASRFAEGVLGPSDFPDWVPASVVETAMIIGPAANPEAQKVIRRLATDPRMKEVWRLLQKRRRSDRAYEYPARRPDFAPLRDYAQNRAMASLFMAAAGLPFSVRPAITRAQLEEIRWPLLELAARWREDLDRLRSVGGFGQNVERPIIDAITELQHRAELIAQPYRQAVVERDTGDARQRSYLVALTAETEKLFGSPLYGTVATIATVALAQKVSAKVVRNVQSLPVKKPKSSA
jgi:hypothetical protein